MNEMLDILIIGAGPAGQTAALYLARKKMKIAVISNDTAGQTAKAALVENYLGFEKISGSDLMEKFMAHLTSTGVQISQTEVKSVSKIDGGFEVATKDVENAKLRAKSVIIAAGKCPRELGVPGEEEFKGKGVSYCATCDGPLFKDKTVAVIGGGNSALDSACEMEKYAKKVYIVNVNADLQGDAILKERFEKSDKGEIINNAKTTEIVGEQFVKGLKYEKVLSDEKAGPRPASPGLEIVCDGIFVEIGWSPATSFLGDLVKLNQLKEIEVDKNGATSLEGIYAAGDVTDTPFKQIIIAAGAGATAALSAWKYAITHK